MAGVSSVGFYRSARAGVVAEQRGFGSKLLACVVLQCRRHWPGRYDAFAGLAGLGVCAAALPCTARLTIAKRRSGKAGLALGTALELAHALVQAFKR